MKLKVLLVFLIGAFAEADGRNLTAFFSACTFNSPAKGPFVETYLTIVGNSVKLEKNENGKYRGKVEVELTFTQSGEIKYHDKYNLLGSEIDDTSKFRPDFIDVQRMTMANGDYDLELKISDKFASGQAFSAHRPVKIDFPEHKISLSDIELIASYTKEGEQNNFTKSGLSIVPLVSDFYPPVLTSVKFYAEIYSSNRIADDSVYISYFITSAENRRLMRNMSGSRYEAAKDVIVLVAELTVKDLFSGNYELNVEVLNKSKTALTSKKVFFQRSNMRAEQNVADLKTLDIRNTFVEAITNRDTLKDYIESLRPISTYREADFADNQLALADVKYMQQFFYDFWLRRNGSDPEKEWNDYLIEVKKVNAAYSTPNQKGYATDRGRIYLKYGPPNSIVKDENDPSAYPWEIWHYYKLGHETNRKFLFYCHEPATNIYTLLHSDAQGEVYNSRWQVDLFIRDTHVPLNDIDRETDPNREHSRVVEAWNNPQ